MLNSRDWATASSVRLGVAMLNVTMGIGRRESEVKEDMVMPRGVGPCVSSPGPGSGVDVGVDMAVHTTTECGRKRITARNCSGRGRESCGSGWIEGDVGAESVHDGDVLRQEGEDDMKGLCAGVHL